MRAALLLLLGCLSIASAANWYVWTQASDANGEWGFLNFYPKALTINPGDSVTFTQNHDTGIIALFGTGAAAPSQFYTAGTNPCDASCEALTQYSVAMTGGPLGDSTQRRTHVDSLDTFAYSAGFMAAADEGLPVPSTWTFYFDPNILQNVTGDYAVTAYEILHVMRMQIIITANTNIGTTPTAANASALNQISLDVGKIPSIWNTTVAPRNGLEYNKKTGAWTVYLGAQAEPTADGYGIGSFDRFMPFDTNTRKSTININQGDSIMFKQLTPHAHSVSIYSLGNEFPPTVPSFNVAARTLTYPSTHFIPNPQPGANGVANFTGTRIVVGAMLFPGTNATVQFNCPTGTYYYFCFFHEAVNMVGEINVLAPGSVKYPKSSAAVGVLPLAALVALLLVLFM